MTIPTQGAFINAVDEDPFFSEANKKRLMKAIQDIEAGRVTEHELLEVDDDEVMAR